MAVLLLMEWDNPMDESLRKKRYKFNQEVGGPFWQKKIDEGFFKASQWSDNMGHIVGLLEFEDMDAFTKLWLDEGFQKWAIEMNYLVDNIRHRIMRPSISVEPK